MNERLYRKDSNGRVRFWEARPFTGEGKGDIVIRHGQVDGQELTEVISTNRPVQAEIKSRYTSKLKQGYVSLADVKDNCNLPVKGELLPYLQAYLPDERTTYDGSLLPMLAKVYDNDNNKVFAHVPIYLGQWKINGLRCFIRAIEEPGLFSSIKFTFQSREGTYWNSLDSLSDYLIQVLPRELIDKMLYEDWILDGELYLYGFTVNQINHFVKNPTSPYNKLIQFWCYDCYIANTTQFNRLEQLYSIGYSFLIKSALITPNIVSRFMIIPYIQISDGTQAVRARDKFIDLGFEGLILRNPNIEYEAGKRKMIKFKRATDGKFTILDVIPDGVRRPDVGKLVCRNDINDATFDCHWSATIDDQKMLLKNKQNYINRIAYISYGERSGVNQLPFHIQNVTIK